MADDNIYIERVLVKDLPALAAAAVDGAAPGTFIPITKHRAEAHTHNPLLKPGDVGLLLAKEGERNVGYFGMMPVMLQHQGRQHRVFWLTTWAVAPGYLGKGLGSRLMQAAVDVGVDLAIVGSKPARRVSAKFGFHELEPLDYVRIDFAAASRFNPITLALRGLRKLFSLVGIKLPIDKLAEQTDSIFDYVFGPVLRPFLLWCALRPVAPRAKQMRFREVKQLDSEEVPPPDPTWSGFYRGPEVINWMLSHPWVVLPENSASHGLDFGFTDWRYSFEIRAYQLIPPGDVPPGFVCLQRSRIHNRHVTKLLDYQLIPGWETPQLALALGIGQKPYLASNLVEGPAELEQVIPKWMRPLVVTHFQRTLQVHPASEDSPLAKAWPHMRQTYVDGDMAFT